ncbi:embryonic cell protein 63 [Planoprotostelium fungivorum]|uniref:Embryonic cell protein 63 n=1 Tax=Planoprotostelium fungivorum TaxID=1890364 RepID=A0A2P6NH10_9EUKA|nr:embryonic cell protein 63 [Planoprotostelium fungivorum]
MVNPEDNNQPITDQIAEGAKKAVDVTADAAVKAKDVVVEGAGFVADKAVLAKEAVVEGAVKAKDVISEKAVAGKDILVENAVKAKDAIAEGAVKTKDVVVENAVKAKDVVAENAVKAKDAIAEGAVKTKDVVTEGAIKAKDVVADSSVKGYEATKEAIATAGTFMGDAFNALKTRTNSLVFGEDALPKAEVTSTTSETVTEEPKTATTSENLQAKTPMKIGRWSSPVANACVCHFQVLQNTTTNNSNNNNYNMRSIFFCTFAVMVCLAAAESPYNTRGLAKMAEFMQKYQDVSLLKNINVLGNVVGGQENRGDILNYFRGPFAGSNKRGFFEEEESFTLEKFSGGQSFFENLLKVQQAYENLSLLRDINVLGNFFGGKQNRLDLANFFQGTDAGSF